MSLRNASRPEENARTLDHAEASRPLATTPIPAFAPNDTHIAKCRLIDDLEAVRGTSCAPAIKSAAPSTAALDAVARLSDLRQRAAQPAAPGSTSTDEVTTLREQLRVAQSTSALFQEELLRLEQKALAAIAEAGELRRRLDLLTEEDAKHTKAGSPETAVPERKQLERTLEATEDQGRLLTRALNESEIEIFRLSKSIDMLVRKLGVV